MAYQTGYPAPALTAHDQHLRVAAQLGFEARGFRCMEAEDRRQVIEPSTPWVNDLTKEEAELLLDCLERQGCTGLELRLTATGFAVRGRLPRG